MARFFVHKTTGAYLGSFSDGEHEMKDENGAFVWPGPANSREIPAPPEHAAQVWNNTAKTWSQKPEEKREITAAELAQKLREKAILTDADIARN